MIVGFINNDMVCFSNLAQGWATLLVTENKQSIFIFLKLLLRIKHSDLLCFKNFQLHYIRTSLQ